MKAYAISFDGGITIDKSKIFTKEEDAEKCKEYIYGKCNIVTTIVELDINKYYNDDIWHEKWGYEK